ncbi:MAG: hypothetical protein HY291_07400 [Planctomycetes bacterium]|nr:hypothetical protein [Planctomycetota bacterium]
MLDYGLIDREKQWLVEDLIQLCLMAGVFCGPGILMLSYGIMVSRRDRFKHAIELDLKGNLFTSAMQGALLSFINLPAYSSLTFFKNDPNSPFLICALFGITGFTCGLWIGWQAWKEVYPSEGLIPRFGLRTLLLFVMAWGIVLAVFMPR